MGLDADSGGWGACFWNLIWWLKYGAEMRSHELGEGSEGRLEEGQMGVGVREGGEAAGLLRRRRD
jgi:hypothetical protein